MGPLLLAPLGSQTHIFFPGTQHHGDISDLMHFLVLKKGIPCSHSIAPELAMLLPLAAAGGVIRDMAHGCPGRGPSSSPPLLGSGSPGRLLCCVGFHACGPGKLVMLAGAQWAERQTLLRRETYPSEGEPLPSGWKVPSVGALSKGPVVFLKE